MKPPRTPTLDELLDRHHGIAGKHKDIPPSRVWGDFPCDGEIKIEHLDETKAAILKCQSCGRTSVDGKPFTIEMPAWAKDRKLDPLEE